MATIELSGKVTNQAGTDLEGLAVQLYTSSAWEASGSTTATDTTDSDGLWNFDSVAQGTYIVVVNNSDSTKKLLFDGRNEAQFTNLDLRSTLQVDTINEATSGTGVTIDGVLLKDGGISVTADFGLNDAVDLEFGTGNDALMRWSTGDSSNHALTFALGDSNQALHITDKGAVATDWNISATTHPNVYIHSNTTPATDYLRLGDHDGTLAYVDVVGGTTLHFQIAGSTEVSITASGLTLPANSDLLFTGTTGTNDIVLTNGLADALSITDGSADIVVIDTSTAGNVITLTSALNIGSSPLTTTGTITGPSGTWDSGGMDIAASDSYAVAGTDILSDSTGTMTLSNVDALDATTESTIEAAIDTLANLTAASALVTVGALNSGSIATGFGAIDNGTSNITTGGIIKLDIDGSAENAAGSITFGAGNDAGIFFDGGDLVIISNGAGANGIIFDAEDDTIEFKGSGTLLATINTTGLVLAVSDAVTFGAVAVLSDSSGTMTLSNVDALDATTEATIEAAIDTLANLTAATALTSIGTLSSLAMSGDINLDGNNIDNGGVIFLKEQAEADADVAGSGQIWVDTQTPNKLFFTDDAGTDFDLSGGGGGPTEATQDDMEDEGTTNADRFVSAEGIKYAPGTAIAHVFIVGSDGSNTGVKNGLSATSRAGTGNYRGTYTTALSAATDANPICGCPDNAPSHALADQISTTQYQTQTQSDGSGTAADRDNFSVVFGVHA
jgi:hypothetical protein